MKKVLMMLVMVFMAVANVHAAKIKQMIFFGDSLSDNGNIYKILLHIIPKSPPYYEGRFSNGITWAEGVGNYYHKKNGSDYSVYAVGGATAIFHMPTTKFISPATLDVEVTKYLIDSLFQDRSEILFSIWIGGNDYLFDADSNVDELTTQVTNKISSEIETLRDHGAKNFLILNLPDLARVPQVMGSGLETRMHALTVLHNQKLDAIIQRLKSRSPDTEVTYIDIYSMFNEVMDNPQKYNEKYNVNITNTTEACWNGGYFIKKALSAQTIASDMRQAIANQHLVLPKNVDIDAMSDFVSNNPELAYAYQLGKSTDFGNIPCANASEHVYWDHIHPTEVAHRVLTQVVIEALGN